MISLKSESELEKAECTRLRNELDDHEARIAEVKEGFGEKMDKERYGIFFYMVGGTLLFVTSWEGRKANM